MGTNPNKNTMIPEGKAGSPLPNVQRFHPSTYFPTTRPSLGPSQGIRYEPVFIAPISSISSGKGVNTYGQKTKPKKNKKQKTSASTDLGPKQPKKKPSTSKKSKRPIKPETNSERKNPDIDMSTMDFDFSEVPSPVCSCTGIPRMCYRWGGGGGWQSSCCNHTVSEFPLPKSTTKPGVRVPGRKMSKGAYSKLIFKLASEGHDLSRAVDLKDHWARHGTNKFVTIK